jgi:transcriptional regulator with XRE-family HTH domain
MSEKTSPLQAARRAASLTQHELAERAGVSRAWLSCIEKAPVLASPALLARLAVTLGVPLETLIVAASRRRVPEIF